MLGRKHPSTTLTPAKSFPDRELCQAELPFLQPVLPGGRCLCPCRAPWPASRCQCLPWEALPSRMGNFRRPAWEAAVTQLPSKREAVGLSPSLSGAWLCAESQGRAMEELFPPAGTQELLPASPPPLLCNKPYPGVWQCPSSANYPPAPQTQKPTRARSFAALTSSAARSSPGGTASTGFSLQLH